MKTRFTYYSAPWGYPTTVIGHRAGRYFDIRQDGWGGYVVSGMIPANEITMKMVRVAPQAGWREAILKYLARL